MTIILRKTEKTDIRKFSTGVYIKIVKKVFYKFETIIEKENAS
jgi:hypothetical protein